ncbi:MAG: TonB-dependent receptor [Ignavibacteriaceae bacterium]
MHNIYKMLILVLFLTTSMLAQNYTISGVVTSSSSNEKLEGANIVLKGTSIGTASDENGKYSISAPAGEYTIACSYIGYEKVEQDINLKKNLELNFTLKDYQFTLNVTVIADRAKERETPVAFSDIEKRGMEMRLGSRDIPLALNTTPSVYATPQGGGAGDSRINLRGFNQRNVAIMINGVPVNDMENAWVYWSNWDGVGDATASIQIQRGLSATTLATPSIGGTINIITDPTAQKYGVNFKQEFGSGAFQKSTLSANSGLINGKFGFNALVVRKTGVGIVDGTWTDAWAYYFGAGYNINDKNRIELYALGAPQRHGQNLYEQNIAAYSHSFASDLGYTNAQLAIKPERGLSYNENWNGVSPAYTGKQYWDGNVNSRYSQNFINERENYYDKPIVNLNYYTQLSEKTSWYTTLYYSGGKGGGSGTAGSMAWDRTGPSQVVNWDATIAKNDTSSNGSLGILRNSVNTQWTIGAISKAFYKLTDQIKLSGGIDWRTAQIEHYQEVRDLLGGSYYYYTGNEFDSPSQYQKGLGDKFSYNETNNVNWFGFYAQAEYTKDKLSAYGTYGWSTIKYKFTDHFHKDASGNELVLQSSNIDGYQVKGGASYRVTDNVDVYANAGYVVQVPIFDQVIDDVTGTKADNPKTQNYTDIEGGINFNGLGGKLAVKLNYYYTIWKNQANSINVTDETGNTSVIFLTGVNSIHSGFELDAAYQPINFFRLGVTASLGNWKYTDDVNGVYKDYSGNTLTETKYHYYVKDLKVGDAPQTQFTLQGTFIPIGGLEAEIVYRHNSNYYANWDPFSRTTSNDVGQVWKTPAYGVFDLHFSYLLPIDLKDVHLTFFAHIFNVFDQIYIQDATDNSQYNGISGAPSHSAQRAEVFLGLPRYFNAGVRINL